ncbi:GNAT family N-acetyltransferase [Polymorphum gilvum]|uniref:Acetyltransferase, GNAT family n=1 Tax=Polymorphum gilvum (strain LMG 25793 / CGMCC 1.9160 / SL003B-26A1) TaxID=991905 RepID=F2IZF2_POLGS|nr:GNAT family N-acetyltransferase [Polymorphum gilvum]ADZ68575.1 Acetyltransferase, GNAT family [Polymorphum gilvum SL003B-26A1]
MSKLDIKALGPDDALHLAPLIAENAQALKRGAPRRPDQFYAEKILGDRTAEVIGAFADGRLVGFAVFFDLPELITGLRVGQIDDIYVRPEAREQGIARRMIETLVTEGQSRGWLQLRWLVPEKNEAALALYDQIAEPDNLKSYVIRIDRLAG